MLAGEPYRADAEVSVETTRADTLATIFNTTAPDDAEGRARALADLIGELGAGAHVRPPLRVDLGYRITLGDGVFVNFGAVMLDVAPIRIGAHTQIGPNVQLLTPTHPIDPEERRAGWESAEPITIGENVWLGGGVIVCPGVTIGDNTVVGAGAVVARDLPANVVAVGNPARVIKEIPVKETVDEAV
ncbi:sugar O-acetyltransferase [Nocardiopsis sp. MG754419]|uniref:sugar O-acetyltransferase n=1 Tax=Nocardiopsis sp. MG754419 TaxID=2259865 RepID=UPI001BA59415|nr:sugar O-acetyltransferase [Nocardiopsis sp. MG754419]MBR8743912.1 sugar O-acetyltransferase [Nocardiopsis sp. MG754419]